MAIDGAEAAIASARDQVRDAIDFIGVECPSGDKIRAVVEELERAHGTLRTGLDAPAPLDALTTARKSLTTALARLQELAHAQRELRPATAAVARTLSLIYPLCKAFEQRGGPGNPDTGQAPIPLTRERKSRDPAPVSPTGAKPRLQILPEVDEDRRFSDRVSVDVDIGFQSETQFFTGFSEDISGGGIFIATHDTLPLGTRLSVSFVLPDGHRVTARGRVSWLREARGASSAYIPGMGVRFNALGEDDQEAILRFLEKRSPLFHDE